MHEKMGMPIFQSVFYFFSKIVIQYFIFNIYSLVIQVPKILHYIQNLELTYWKIVNHLKLTIQTCILNSNKMEIIQNNKFIL
jgi:hypothetical protein